MKSKISVIIQSRTGSTRLPNKVLAKIEDKPMICHVIDRMKKVPLVEQIILATSANPNDNVLLKIAEDNMIVSYAGKKFDVLDRFFHAAQIYNADPIIRITADCPLIDFKLVNEMIDFFTTHNFDYVSNTIENTYPDGLDTEIFSFKTLKTAFNYAKLPSEREHVTPYIKKNPNLFKIFNYKNKQDLSNFRLSVDEETDLILVKKIFEEFHPQLFFTTDDVVKFLKKNPKICQINSGVINNQGYLKSIQEDKLK